MFKRGYYCDTCSKDVTVFHALINKLAGHKVLRIEMGIEEN